MPTRNQTPTGQPLRRRWTVTPFGWCMISLGLGALVLPRQVFNGVDPRPVVGVTLVLIVITEAAIVRGRDRYVHATATIAPILLANVQAPISVQANGVSLGLVRVRHFTTEALNRDGRATLIWTPRRRGIFRLRDVRLCVGGPFGLLERTKELAANGHGVVCVGPKRFVLQSGDRPLPFPLFAGDPVDLHGIRPYTPGDDVRGIHWRLSAREGRPMVITSVSPRSVGTVAVDLGPTEGPKAERWAQIAATFLDQALDNGPLTLVVRDSQGIARMLINSPNDVSAALASACTGEPVPIDDVAVYLGVWRNDLEAARSAGVVIVSDDRFPDGDSPPDAQSDTQPDTRSDTRSDKLYVH